MALIELVGLPGAGKTTLTNALSEALEIPVASKALSETSPWRVRFPRKVGFALSTVVAEPGNARAAVADIRSLDASLTRRIRLIVAAFVGMHLRRQHRDRHAIADEGLAQLQVSLAMDGQGQGGSRPELDRSLVADLTGLVVLLSSDLDEVQARLEARSSRHSSYQHLDGPALRAALVSGQERIFALQENLAQHQVPFVVVAGDDPSADAVSTVVAAWESLSIR